MVAFVGLVVAGGCAHRSETPAPGSPSQPTGWREKGGASWYGHPYHGRRTASGEVYDMHQLTAAHRTLAFGTVVRVTRRDDGRRVEVRVNDRGPFVKGRIIDLSYAAAKRIGLDLDGVTAVEIEVVGRDERRRPSPAAPPSQSKASDDDCWWVQVGAFGDLDNARRARDVLRARGFAVVVMEGPGGLHRVRVGPSPKRADAEGDLAQLAADYPPAAIVRCGD
jgi:rare lipoprotein A